LNDGSRVATGLLRRAGVCTYLREHGEARRAAEHALELCRGIADQPGEAEALRELGFVHWHAEDCAAALGNAREALTLHRRLGDVAGEASALHNLAEIYRGLGSPLQALEWYEQAMQLHWASKNHVGEILSLFGMANALHQTGDLAGSERKYESAMKLSDSHGERTMQSRALHAIAMLHFAQKNHEPALRFMVRAVEVDRAIGYAHALGHDLVDLSDIHLFRRERTEARAALHEALVWFGFTEDHDALVATRTRIEDLDSGQGSTALPAAPRHGIKSHLPLGEGKVYCEFDSPLTR
jgi:tetratricopeptide (TPR) repeat protein